MEKKIYIQIILFFIIVLIIVVTFNKYFNKDAENLLTINKNEINEVSKNVNGNNTIKDVYYVSKDNAGNTYEISSVTGVISLQSTVNNIHFIYQDEPTPLMLMKNVTAKISFTDSPPIDITSTYAKYNNETYETKFFGDVIVKYVDHKIKADAMNLATGKNLATLERNIFYNHADINLIADMVEIDLLTKESKIFMNDINKKVLIIGKN